VSRCDRCSRDFEHAGVFTVSRDSDGAPQWTAIFCSEECRDSFVDKYRDRPEVALEVLSLHTHDEEVLR
jgi:hypothetical protein